MEIQNEIDKLLTLKESFSKIAGSYGSLVPKEFVTIQLHAENTDLSAYKIKVVNTTSGNDEFYDISASGYTEFEVKYDSVYEIVFPIIGVYITPSTRTFTAQKPMRKIEASYVMAGVFGLDEQGNRYSLEQIEALEDKSIIKYGGYTDYDLENYQKADGTFGCGFMWEIGNEYSVETYMWASEYVEFNQELLPFLSAASASKGYFDGEAYTDYILSEGVRLGCTTPAASWCNSQIVMIKDVAIKGMLISYGQFLKLSKNKSLLNTLYDSLQKDVVVFEELHTSIQVNASLALSVNNYVEQWMTKRTGLKIFLTYPLPK